MLPTLSGDRHVFQLSFRPLIREMLYQNQSMLVYLSGWLNKLTSHLQLGKEELADPSAFLISMALNHLMYVKIVFYYSLFHTFILLFLVSYYREFVCAEK